MACEERKAEALAYDSQNKQLPKLNEFEEEAKQETQCLLNKANKTKLEQDEEIRNLNKVCLHLYFLRFSVLDAIDEYCINIFSSFAVYFKNEMPRHPR